MQAAGGIGRHRHRDRTLILIGYMSFGLKTVRQRPTLCKAPSCGR
jgi:hypothetical protein